MFENLVSASAAACLAEVFCLLPSYCSTACRKRLLTDLQVKYVTDKGNLHYLKYPLKISPSFVLWKAIKSREARNVSRYISVSWMFFFHQVYLLRTEI